MDEFKRVLRLAVDAAADGDLEANWVAQMLLAHLRSHAHARPGELFRRGGLTGAEARPRARGVRQQRPYARPLTC